MSVQIKQFQTVAFYYTFFNPCSNIFFCFTIEIINIKTIFTNLSIILGLIFFDVGHKNPKIIMHNYDYLMYRKLTDKTVWLCAHYHKKDRCKAKVTTAGKFALVHGGHNHETTYRQKYPKHMLSRRVKIHYDS